MKKISIILVSLLLLMLVFAGELKAQQGRDWGAKPTNSILEEDQPWPGSPWIAGGVLAVGAVFVGIKNAKRTHLD